MFFLRGGGSDRRGRSKGSSDPPLVLFYFIKSTPFKKKALLILRGLLALLSSLSPPRYEKSFGRMRKRQEPVSKRLVSTLPS